MQRKAELPWNPNSSSSSSPSTLLPTPKNWRINFCPPEKLPASTLSPKSHHNTGGRVKSKKPTKSCSSSKPAPPSSMNSLHSSKKTIPTPSPKSSPSPLSAAIRIIFPGSTKKLSNQSHILILRPRATLITIFTTHLHCQSSRPLWERVRERGYEVTNK